MKISYISSDLRRKFYKENSDINELNKSNKIKTRSRSSIISKEIIGSTILVYNGKTYIPLRINKDILGYKLGEFVLTRKLGKHPRSKRPRK